MIQEMTRSKSLDSNTSEACLVIRKLGEMEDHYHDCQLVLHIKKQTEQINAATAKGEAKKKMALRRIKRYESQLNRLDETLAEIRFQREELEKAGEAANVADTLERAYVTFKLSDASPDPRDEITCRGCFAY